MYCPSCGKKTPNGSTFCLHCGNRIVAPRAEVAHTPRTPIEWEYKDFVIEYPPGKRGKVYIGPGGYTIPGGRLLFWQSEQANITRKLQSWLDEGWEPVGEVGPACFQVRTYRKWQPPALFLILGILSFGLLLIIELLTKYYCYDYMEVTEFRLPMRRPKR